MARRRLGVALLLDPPVASEVDGMRRAVGDGALARIAPHITLVPPVNVGAAELPAALRVLRAAAAGCGGPLRLTLGPPATFLPANPVLYLEVGGDLERLRALAAAVERPPLARPRSWPWTPHVTLADRLAPERIEAALAALGGYAVVADPDRLVLLEERRASGAPRWVPLADAVLGPPTVVGRGGIELTIFRGRVVGPDVRALVEADDSDGADAQPPGPGGPVTGAGAPGEAISPVVLTAYREGGCVGAASGWWDADRPWVGVYVAPQARRSGVGAHLLACLESTLRSVGWSPPELWGIGPPGFYARQSSWVRPAGG